MFTMNFGNIFCLSSLNEGGNVQHSPFQLITNHSANLRYII